MGDLSDAIEGARADLAIAAPEFLPDTCNLITSASTPDTFGGTTETPTTVASNVPCSYKVLGNPMQRQVGGGPMTTLTHVITLPSTAVTKVIRPDYQIVVAALNGKPALTFENPVRLDGSLSPFIKVAAELQQ